MTEHEGLIESLDLAAEMAYVLDPYAVIHKSAKNLGLEETSTPLYKEGTEKAIDAGVAFVQAVDEGQIKDRQLAYDLAVTENQYRTVANLVEKEGLLKVAEFTRAQLIVEHNTKIIDYKAKYLGILAVGDKKYSAELSKSENPLWKEAEGSLPKFSPEEIETLFDTSPMTRDELSKIGEELGRSKSQWGRTLVKLYDLGIERYDAEKHTLPSLGRVYIEGSGWASTPLPEFRDFEPNNVHIRSAGHTLNNLDIKSLFKLVYAVEDSIESGQSAKPIHEALGRMGGVVTLQGFRAILLSRRK